MLFVRTFTCLETKLSLLIILYNGTFLITRSGGNTVDMGTGYVLNEREVQVRSRIFSSLQRPDRPWGPTTFYPMGTAGSLPGVKRPAREADHLPPTSTEVKKTWI
jgi:hypothetical protein